ncbi:MAG TPA: hypothetical protein VK116_03130, partial [Planctomycetota bacterium]|nr:hypothetical protein [Planctomycetota bacterium]
MSEEPLGPDPLTRSLLTNERLAEVAAMGIPAFVRRALRMERALEELDARLRSERSRRLASLLPQARALAAAGAEGARLPSATRALLETLRAEPDFARRKASPPRRIDRAIDELALRVKRFNEGWINLLERVPIDEVRMLQRDYNRFYPIEKQCALRGVRQAPFEPVRLLERE